MKTVNLVLETSGNQCYMGHSYKRAHWSTAPVLESCLAGPEMRRKGQRHTSSSPCDICIRQPPSKP